MMNAFDPLSRKKLLLAAIAVLPPLPSTIAQSIGDDSGSTDVSTAVRLAPVVVTAVHETGNALKIVLDARAPAQPIPAQDGADYLKSVPGFGVIRKGGTDGDPVLRGMAGSRLVVALDDQCVLGGCGNRMDPPTAYVFPAAYDRITILKGPQTVLHGPGNSAGVVLFESDRGRSEDQQNSGHASITSGSFGRLDLAIDGLADTGIVYGRATLTRTRSADHDDGAGNPVHAAHRRWSANAALGWTPDEETLVEISAARSDGEAAYADRMMDGVKFDRSNLAIRLRRESLSSILSSAELQFGYNDVDHVMDNYSLRAFTPSMMMPGRAVSNPARRTLGGKVLLELNPDRFGGYEIALGTDFQSNRHSVRSSGDEPADPYKEKSRQRDADFFQTGVFSELTRRIGERQRFVTGLRHDFWRAEDHRKAVRTGMMQNTPNPSAGRARNSELASGFARYEGGLAHSDTNFFVGIGYVARFPDYWEMIKNESRDSVSAFSTGPEKTTQLDFGATYRGGQVDVSISGYISTIDDYNLVQNSVVKPADVMGTRMAVITRNVDAATFGGEASVRWRLSAQWKLDADLAYVRGTNRTDHLPLAQLPPLQSRLGLTYTRTRWSVAGLIRAVAAQNRVAMSQGNIVGQDIGPTPGYAVFSVNTAWSLSQHARLAVGVDNVFDKAYAEHISRAGSLVTGYPQTTRVNEPGRALWVRLDLAQ